ncbi:hypothetical protein [Cognatiyoonia sp. IB215182]|uniref:hypothetical protein n=1 Tax=Cognatiyoonia sp. IB215182 TaxID=3097353 RepID=UPI002A0D9D41|nr:hypothetical protein [Cognatiyoonia sp. IB215182]MDX8353483.1 hypothetical protein [Cognatiyoonia sp. IB215182]
MHSFTFDTNCLIDLDEKRPASQFVWELIDAHRQGIVSVAFVSVSASERQKGDYYLPSYQDFVDRLETLGVQDIPQIMGMFYWGLSYWGQCIYGDKLGIARELALHKALFPKIPFYFAEYAKKTGLSEGDTQKKEAKKWRNAWCDRQMVWAHDYHKRDVFVSSDGNFKSLAKYQEFRNVIVSTPEEATQLL